MEVGKKDDIHVVRPNSQGFQFREQAALYPACNGCKLRLIGALTSARIHQDDAALTAKEKTAPGAVKDVGAAERLWVPFSVGDPVAGRDIGKEHTERERVVYFGVRKAKHVYVSYRKLALRHGVPPASSTTLAKPGDKHFT